MIEFKLRYLKNDPLGCARICCIFDCCRVSLTNMTGLLQGRGIGGAGEEEEIDSDAELPCNYIQICACGPGGIADADGGFAAKLLGVCEKYSERDPVGYLSIPSDFTKVSWAPGFISLGGGESYLIPFGGAAGGSGGLPNDFALPKAVSSMNWKTAAERPDKENAHFKAIAYEALTTGGQSTTLSAICEKFAKLDQSKRNLKKGSFYHSAIVSTKAYRAKPLKHSGKGCFNHEMTWDEGSEEVK